MELDFADSTNKYAMRLIDADKAQDGLTIVAKSQTEGKGQRENKWYDAAGESVLMSIIASPKHGLQEQAVFNCAVAVAVADVLKAFDKNIDPQIKFPNDLIINAKKTGGILIENVIRGNHWAYSVVGVGINVLQNHFPEDLPYATSLKIATGNNLAIRGLIDALRIAVLEAIKNPKTTFETLERYNAYLFKKNKKQLFEKDGNVFEATLLETQKDGRLLLLHEDGTEAFYAHGALNWVWN